MPKMSGLGLLKTLKSPPKTILITAHREYAVEGYDLDVIDYLLKPVTFERFFKAIERYLRQNQVTIIPDGIVEKDQFVVVKSAYKYVKIKVDDILYIESARDYIKLFTIEKTIISKYKISDIEKELSSASFLRIHRSFLVNKNKITAFTKNDIEIGRIELPIGELYRELVHAALVSKN